MMTTAVPVPDILGKGVKIADIEKYAPLLGGLAETLEGADGYNAGYGLDGTFGQATKSFP